MYIKRIYVKFFDKQIFKYNLHDFITKSKVYLFLKNKWGF